MKGKVSTLGKRQGIGGRPESSSDTMQRSPAGAGIRNMLLSTDPYRDKADVGFLFFHVQFYYRNMSTTVFLCKSYKAENGEITVAV